MIARTPRTPQAVSPTALDATASPPAERDLEHPLLVLRVHGEEDRRTFFGYACRISCEGLRIDATRPRDQGETYELEFPLPTPLEGTARCRCEVAWKRDWARGLSPGMGLRFLDLPAEIATELDRWVERENRRPVYRADAVA